MNLLKRLFDLSPIGIKIYTRKFLNSEKKIDYQKRYVDFNIKEGEKVLDIGCGNEPFSLATHVADKYPGDTHHRSTKLNTKNLPFTQADVQDLPFENQSFDFMYCSHLLEHVEPCQGNGRAYEGG